MPAVGFVVSNSLTTPGIERDQQSSDAAVAVEIGMNGLELHVNDAEAHERRQAILRVKVLLQIAEERGQFFRWRRNEGGVSRPRPADPVLTAADLARLLVRAAHSSHQSAVRLVEQPRRER